MNLTGLKRKRKNIVRAIKEHEAKERGKQNKVYIAGLLSSRNKVTKEINAYRQKMRKKK